VVRKQCKQWRDCWLLVAKKERRRKPRKEMTYKAGARLLRQSSSPSTNVTKGSSGSLGTRASGDVDMVSSAPSDAGSEEEPVGNKVGSKHKVDEPAPVGDFDSLFDLAMGDLAMGDDKVDEHALHGKGCDVDEHKVDSGNDDFDELFDQALEDRKRARMHACMNACTHACTHARTHARINACMHARKHACMHACMCSHACSHACMQACMRACVHARMHACMHACIYMHARTHACMHACVHACMHALV
jgi:hypothetical protein